MNRQKKKIVLFILVMGILASGIATAQEGPSPEALRQTIRDHIAEQEKIHGAFSVVDQTNNELRRLELIRVHERVGKTGDYYYSCTDMKDVRTGNEFDLDFDIEDKDGNLKVVDIRIHKENGEARYTYGEDDKLVPLTVEEGQW